MRCDGGLFQLCDEEPTGWARVRAMNCGFVVLRHCNEHRHTLQHSPMETCPTEEGPAPSMPTRAPGWVAGTAPIPESFALGNLVMG